jgi:putative ABC transport system permease protein
VTALSIKLWRELWALRGQTLAIALVTASGIAVFVMAIGALASLDATRTAFYERYRFAEVFATLKRAPERLAETIAELPGVQAVETRVVVTADLAVPGFDEPVLGRLLSLPEFGEAILNVPHLRQGRLPEAGRLDEALISEAFAEAHMLRPGDHVFANLEGTRRRLDITGIALSPEYVYAMAPGALLPDDERYGILWLPRPALAAAFDLDGAFNDISLTLLRGARPEAVIDPLDRLLDAYGGQGAYPRADQLSHFFLDEEIQQLAVIAAALPVIFLAVAVFLLNTVTARLVAMEREAIGVLKAFGYSSVAIGLHYVKLVLFMTLPGIVLGLLGGIWLARALTVLYTQFFRFPFIQLVLEPLPLVAVVLVTLTAALLGSAGAVRAASRLAPAEAMRPPTPPSYQGLAWLTRLHLDQPSLMILRHLVRFPLRAVFSVAGIAAAVAILLTSQHFLDAVEVLLEHEFEEARRYDLAVSFFEPQHGRAIAELRNIPGVLAVEPQRQLAVRFVNGSIRERGAVTGVLPDARLERILDAAGHPLAVPADGLVLSLALARKLAVGRGSRLTVEVLEGRRPVLDLHVAAIVETYLGTAAYMHLDAMAEALREAPQPGEARLRVDPLAEAAVIRALQARPEIAGVTRRQAFIDSFRQTIGETIHITVGFYVLFASLCTIGVVYNAARIGLSERARELASLRVLGFSRSEAGYILLGEMLLLTLIALPLGALLGIGLARAIAVSMESDLFRIPFVIEPRSFAFAGMVVLAAAAGSALVVGRRIWRLDIVSALKTRE